MVQPMSATPALNEDRLRERLERRIDATLARARAGGVPVLASVTTCLGAGDPSATVLDLRRPGEPWFCYEQPERGGFALAGLGCAHAVQGDGPERFSEVDRSWRRLSMASLSDPPVGVPGSGLTAIGGFGFADQGCSSIKWSEFAVASLLVPELSLARSDEQTWLTLNAQVAPDDTRAEVLARIRARLDRMRPATLPIGDPLPAAPNRAVSAISPAHYEAAVASAVKRIRAGELEKIVLAREVEVEASMAFDPASIFGLLRDAFSSSFVYAVGRGDSTFIGATPELLVRREGQRVTTVALAGSARRSADPAVDDHLSEKLLHSDKDREENAIVARRITRALHPRSRWVVAAEQPTVIRVANIQHLATPIRAQLSAPVGAIKLAEMLHPTPAVGAEPASALDSIPALEGIDRGWYAGPVGWTDTSGDGEFCVALRCALLRGRHAYCYAGCGIVADSDPAAELAESEMKLQVMLPALIA
jgi:isochorismate synthase